MTISVLAFALTTDHGENTWQQRTFPQSNLHENSFTKRYPFQSLVCEAGKQKLEQGTCTGRVVQADKERKLHNGNIVPEPIQLLSLYSAS